MLDSAILSMILLRAYIGYNYEVSDIKNISEYASESIKDLEGKNTTSSITTSLIYDSRNRRFNPTRRLSAQYISGICRPWRRCRLYKISGGNRVVHPCVQGY